MSCPVFVVPRVGARSPGPLETRRTTAPPDAAAAARRPRRNRRFYQPGARSPAVGKRSRKGPRGAILSRAAARDSPARFPPGASPRGRPANELGAPPVPAVSARRPPHPSGAAPVTGRWRGLRPFGAAGLLLLAAPALETQPSPEQIREFLRSATGDARAGADPFGPAPGLRPPHDFYFTRAVYSSYGWRGWHVDYPKADRQFLIGLRRYTNLDAYAWENEVLLNDPELGRYPFLYAVEVGYMAMTDEEVAGLRRYLLSGGFLMVDDFWGTQEWLNFAREMDRVFPGRAIEEVPLDHPIFRSLYVVDEIVQVPNVGQGIRGGPTWERDGYTPTVYGIFDDERRLMVVANWNTDLGDAWEWWENPHYPLRYSTYAYEMGVNLIIYAMTH